MEDYNPEHFRTKTRGNDTRKERGSEVHKSAAFSMPQSVPYILEHATRCAQGKKTYQLQSCVQHTLGHAPRARVCSSQFSYGSQDKQHKHVDYISERVFNNPNTIEPLMEEFLPVLGESLPSKSDWFMFPYSIKMSYLILKFNRIQFSYLV